MAEITRRHGDMDLADECRQAAEKIDQQIYDRFWNESRGLYVDSVVDGQQRTRTFSEHTNYLALLAGLGRSGREQIILEKLSHIEEDLYQVDVPFMLFALEALFALHHDDLAVDMMRKRYDRIKRTGSDTLWETWSSQMSIFPDRWATGNWSEAQSAAAVPAFILSSEVLGVKPTAPGFAEFDINPHGGGLSWAEGLVPAPQGEIAVRWEKKAEHYALKVTVPEGTQATVHLPPADAYTVDGQPLVTDRLKRRPDGAVTIVVEKATHTFTAVGLKFRDSRQPPLDKQ